MSTSRKKPSALVRVFCKMHGICVTCRQRWTERGTTRCAKCNRAHAKSQKSRLRRNYEQDVKAGVCVRCCKRPATPTNKRCQQCQDRHANQRHSQPLRNSSVVRTRPPSATTEAVRAIPTLSSGSFRRRRAVLRSWDCLTSSVHVRAVVGAIGIRF